MQDAPKTEAQAAADALLAEYGAPRSPGELRAMLALAYSRGARVAADTMAALATRNA